MARSTFRYIYKTTCLSTGRFYIGKHTCHTLENDYLGSGLILSHSLKKYGKKNHKKEILKFADSLTELNTLEETMVAEVIGDEGCMNIKKGGIGGWDQVAKIASQRGTLYTFGMQGKKHKELSLRKMAKAKIGEHNNQFGKRAFIDPLTGERKLLLERPNGWLSPVEMADSKKKKTHGVYGKKWFNNGADNFLLSADDERTRNLKLGRLNPGFR